MFYEAISAFLPKRPVTILNSGTGDERSKSGSECLAGRTCLATTMYACDCADQKPFVRSPLLT